MDDVKRRRFFALRRAAGPAALIACAGFAPLPAGAPPVAAFCTLDPPIQLSAQRTRDIVRQAPVVVRATSLGRWSARRGYMSFAVREVLHGTAPDTLVFLGSEDARDSFREGDDARIPYLSYFRWYSGDCIATLYRPGAEYLLLLAPGQEDGVLDPYWQLLAPTNEQIRGPDDPWVAWVRQTLAEAEAEPRAPPASF